MKQDVPAMDEGAQQLYINAMLSNPELFTAVNGILSPAYFDPHLAKGVKFLQEYFHEHRGVPDPAIYKAMTKLNSDFIPLQTHDKEAVAKEIAEFCKFQACIEVVKKSMGQGGYFETGDLGSMVTAMKAASEIGLTTDFGINYFDDPQARLDADEKEDPVISTGWKTVDDVIGGGIGLEELVVFLAPSGGGKSVSMLNLAFNLMEQGYDGVYITLEMRDKKVARRTDQMISRLASGKILENKAKVADEIAKFGHKSGAEFFIKRMREGTTTANDIAAYVRKLKAAGYLKKLGFIVVDYLDIMAPVQKGAGESMFLKDKFVSEEVRALGHDFKCIMISASQLGKHATKAINDGEKMHQGDVQGGSSKTNTADLMIATVKTDAMHEAGEYRFEFPKARNSDAGTKQVTMSWSKISLRIADMGSELTFNKKEKTGLQLQSPNRKPATLDDLASGYA